jgi:hypothetical protein
VPVAGASALVALGILTLGGVLFEIPDPTANEYACGTSASGSR